MSEERPSLELLNAYVDGELSTRQASNVARAISDDWELANRVATLSRLKAVVQETFGSDRDGGIALPAEAAASGARPQVVKPVLAAALALVLFIGATSWLHLSGQPASKPWLNRAWALHQAWSAKPVVQADAPSAGLVLAALGHLEPELMNIDLAAARLRLTLAEEFVGTTGTRGLHLGYEGTRGCRISLFLLTPLGDLPADFSSYGEGQRLAYGWRLDDTAHLLLAEGMDPERFRLIAESIHRFTLEAAPFDEPTRIALARSRAESRPCLG